MIARPLPTLLLILLLILPFTAHAETRYVSDQLVLTLRETADPQSPVIGHLKTDDAVEVLGEEGDFARVQAAVGTGYVRKQYLTDARPKTEIIKELEQQLASLQNQLRNASSGTKDQKQQLAELQLLNQTLEKRLQEVSATRDSLQKRYDELLGNSKDLTAIINERDQLRESNGQLTADNEQLREENESLLTKGIIKWFLAGAGTLFFGWLLGKVSRKKRRAF